MATASLQRELKILTDGAQMRAWLRLTPDEDYSSLSDTDILEALRVEGIPVDDRVRSRVHALLDLLKAGTIPKEEFILAEGVPPTDPEDADFVFADTATDATPEDGEPAGEHDNNSGLGRIDFYALTKIRSVAEGQILGQIKPPIPGKGGTDVRGKPIPPRRKAADILIGANVVVDADGRTVRAATAGRLNYSQRRLSVGPAIEIKGDVDFESGSVESPADVIVRRDVLDGFHVRSEKNITVGGAVGACEIRAGGDIHVAGGIAGKGRAQIEAQGDVMARFCNECTIRAGRDIVIARESINSQLHTLGFLRMPRGSLIGGCAYARCGGDIRTLGSDGGVKTQIAIGIDPIVFDKCHEIDEQVAKRKEASARIRQAVQPLMAQLKRLMPAQRERATELMYEADQIDAGVQELLAQKEAMLNAATPEEPPFLYIADRILPNTTVIVGGHMHTFMEERKGPFRILRRKVDRVEEIVLLNALTASQTVLKSRDYRLKVT